MAVVIMDRGLDWDHPDFINPDGSTRIKWLYDMSPEHGSPMEFSEAQINAALIGGPPISSRDAVGHGTVGLQVPSVAALAGALQGWRKDHDLEGTVLSQDPVEDEVVVVDGGVTAEHQLPRPARLIQPDTGAMSRRAYRTAGGQRISGPVQRSRRILAV